MKVIFLDNDGVICLSTEWGGRYKKQKKWGGRKLSMTPSEIPFEYRFDNFNKKAVKVLNEVLEETGAEIVVSSDWRYYASLEELQKYYMDQGITKGPIGVTKRVSEIDPKNWEKNFRNYAKLEEERSLEIKTYLNDHPEIRKFAGVAPEGFILVHEKTLMDLRDMDTWLDWKTGRKTIKEMNKKNFDLEEKTLSLK